MDVPGASREELLREVADLRLRLAAAESAASAAIQGELSARDDDDEVPQRLLERFRRIVEHSTNVFYSHTPDHVLTYLSPQTLDLIGYRPEEALVRWTELVTDHPGNARGLELTQRAIDSGERQDPYELELWHKNGSRVWVEIHEAPVVRGGRTVAIVGALTDRTPRRRAEKLLRMELGLSLALASSKTLEDVLERALEGALAIDEVDAVGFYVVEEDTGGLRLVRPRGLSKTFLASTELLAPEDERVARLRRSTARHFLYEDELCREEGLFATGVFPVRHEGRLIACLNAASRTVEDFSPLVLNTLETIVSQAGPVIARVRAETSLQQSEATLQGLFRAAPAGIGLVTGRVLQWVNDHMTRMTGYPAAELIGRNARMLYETDEEFDRVGRVKYGQIARAGTGSVETRWRRKDGTILFVHLSSSVLDPDDEASGAVFTALDVTEQRQAEAERQRLEAQVQHAQKLESLGVLAGGIAHDFNNILHVILGNAHLAARHLPIGSRALSYLSEVQRSVDRAASLCNQMLAYSGKGSFLVRRIQLGDVVRDIADMLEVSISKKAELEIEVDPHLPAVEADASQIRQVVMNLITNASEALGAEPGRISIRIAARDCKAEDLQGALSDEDLAPGRYVCLRVSDTGCGMPAETRARVFEPFFTTKFAGRGLGMAAVLGIIRSHHGAIRLESEEGSGTAITVTLPVATGAPEPDVDVTDGPSARAGEGTVLFADDEPALLALGQTWLERGGYGVVTASDGRAAVDLFVTRPHEISAAVLDMTMPRMDGQEAFLAMRAVRPDVPVILCSGYSEQELRGRFKEDVPEGFLQKPFDGEDLLRALAEVLEAPGTRT